MKLLKKTTIAAVLGCVSISVFAGGSVVDTDTHLRANIGLGPRYINDEVMTNTRWDTAMELGLGAYKYAANQVTYYGVQLIGNTGWDARYNNGGGSNQQASAVHNSSSMDFMAFLGKKFNSDWSGELGAGAQLSWVKWMNSTSLAEDRSRVLPKIRVSLARQLTSSAKLFVAVNQSFNTYDDLRCTSGTANCINDDGFVSVTDAKIGVTFDLS